MVDIEARHASVIKMGHLHAKTAQYLDLTVVAKPETMTRRDAPNKIHVPEVRLA
jgi:hypothetical protein